MITSVQLGRGGGQSIFSLQTFRGSSFEEGVSWISLDVIALASWIVSQSAAAFTVTFSLWNPEVVDERLRFLGFYQAGSVEVQGHLEGEHSTDAWLRQLPPRAAERGRA